MNIARYLQEFLYTTLLGWAPFGAKEALGIGIKGAVIALLHWQPAAPSPGLCTTATPEAEVVLFVSKWFEPSSIATMSLNAARLALIVGVGLGLAAYLANIRSDSNTA
jgi:hypothetical protein